MGGKTANGSDSSTDHAAIDAQAKLREKMKKKIEEMKKRMAAEVAGKGPKPAENQKEICSICRGEFVGGWFSNDAVPAECACNAKYHPECIRKYVKNTDKTTL